MKKLVVGITAPESIVLLKGQLEYFVNKGYKVFLLAPKDDQTIDFCDKEGVILLPISIKRTISPVYDLYSLIQIICIFRKIKPDIVNLGTPKVSLLGMLAAKMVGVRKRIYTCRGFRFEHEKGSFKKLLIFMEKVTAFCSNKILCISKSVRDLGLEYNIFSIKKTIIINKGSSNGIDLNLFNVDNLDDQKYHELKKEYNPLNNFIFGFVGRIIERKGFKELLVAFNKIYEADENVRLLVVGNIEYDQIDKATIENANLHPGIIMIGSVQYEETPYYYRLMNVFVLPAYWEGFGNVLTQAAAMGVPVISTNVTGCKDAVLHKYNGELIQAKNSDKLYEKMFEFQHSPQLLIKYSVNGLKWARNFEQETIWSGMEKEYTDERR